MKKKITAVLLAFVLLFGVNVTTVCAAEAFDNIKVGLSFGTESVDSFTARTELNIVLGFAQDRDFTPLLTVEGTDVLVEKGGGTYLVSQTDYEDMTQALTHVRELRNQEYEAHAGYIDGKYKVLIGLFADAAAAEESKLLFAEQELFFHTVYLDRKTVMVHAGYNFIVFRHDTAMFAFGSADAGTVRYAGKNYHGYLVADRIHSDKIAVVNLVDFDDYLASVVGSEMYASWHIEALKAQAVIARTYAMTVTSYKSYGIDVTDDTRTQAYNGVSSETASTRRAAQETNGILILYKGALAQTFFTASSGGRTADVYSAWGGGQGLDYLQSVEDTYEDTQNIPNGVWSVSYTPEQITEKLKARGVEIGTLEDVYVEKRGDDERVHRLTFVGSEGKYSVKFESCRTILGLKSQYYYITPPNKTETYALGADGTTTVAENAAVLTSSGIGQTKPGMYVLGANGLKQIETNTKDVYVFDGKGHGHGVGMSQYGAKGMAEAGFTFDEIITHYYKGVTLSEE